MSERPVTHTYLLADRRGGEALLIDPVKEEVGKYLQLIKELDLRLVFAIDTHLHADHVTGHGELRTATSCATIMGEQSRAGCVSRKVRDGDSIDVGGLRIRALYTPGHTDDSYSFVMTHVAPGAAVGMSLPIVGTTSLTASIVHRRRGRVRIPVALLFGRAGVVTAFLGARLTHMVSPQSLMLAFALLMIVVGAGMIRRRRTPLPSRSRRTRTFGGSARYWRARPAR